MPGNNLDFENTRKDNGQLVLSFKFHYLEVSVTNQKIEYYHTFNNLYNYITETCYIQVFIVNYSTKTWYTQASRYDCL